MLKILIFLALTFSFQSLSAQKKPTGTGNTKPKLVIGIVVDQMRADYLERYSSKFSEDGFKRLQREGYHFRNNHFEYFPTYTAPGHASVYTGTHPSIHGIIGNDWYVDSTGTYMYCVEDKSVKTVGSASRQGEMSPRNLLSNTITDQLRLATAMKAKVISISMKDRGAVLPGGHFGKSFWYDESIGGFITSSFYGAELPDWVQKFNASKPAEKYLSQPWNTLLPIEAYTESLPDDNPFEGRLRGEEKPVFPHNLPLLRKINGPGVLRDSPFGNDLLIDLAKEAMAAENLGRNSVTDFLAISFSCTDYLGHRFGPHSVEIQDTYLRLDLLLGEFLKHLDKTVGKGEYTVFLTADHGGEDNAAWLKSMGYNAGYFDGNTAMLKLKSFLFQTFGDSLVKTWNNQQVFLDHEKAKKMKLRFIDVERETVRFMTAQPGVLQAFTSSALGDGMVESSVGKFVQNGYLHGRSGQVTVILQPGWMEYSRLGTTHGSPWPNDTHVPLLFFGKGIPQGSTTRRSGISDIAPTLSMLLGIRLPNGAVGTPLQFD